MLHISALLIIGANDQTPFKIVSTQYYEDEAIWSPKHGHCLASSVHIQDKSYKELTLRFDILSTHPKST